MSSAPDPHVTSKNWTAQLQSIPITTDFSQRALKQLIVWPGANHLNNVKNEGCKEEGLGKFLEELGLAADRMGPFRTWAHGEGQTDTQSSTSDGTETSEGRKPSGSLTHT